MQEVTFCFSRSAICLHLCAVCRFWNSYPEVYSKKASLRTGWISEVTSLPLGKRPFNGVEWRLEITDNLWLGPKMEPQNIVKNGYLQCFQMEWDNRNLVKFSGEIKVWPLGRGTRTGEEQPCCKGPGGLGEQQVDQPWASPGSKGAYSSWAV